MGKFCRKFLGNIFQYFLNCAFNFYFQLKTEYMLVTNHSTYCKVGNKNGTELLYSDVSNAKFLVYFLPSSLFIYYFLPYSHLVIILKYIIINISYMHTYIVFVEFYMYQIRSDQSLSCV